MFYASQSLMKYSNTVHGEHVDGDGLGTYLPLVSGSQNRSHNLLSSVAIGADQVLSPPTYCHSDGSLPTEVDN